MLGTLEAVATADLPVLGPLMSPIIWALTKESASEKSVLEGHTSMALKMHRLTKYPVISAVGVFPTVLTSTRRIPIPLAVHTEVLRVSTRLHLRTFDHATLRMEWLDQQVILRQTFPRRQVFPRMVLQGDMRPAMFCMNLMLPNNQDHGHIPGLRRGWPRGRHLGHLLPIQVRIGMLYSR